MAVTVEEVAPEALARSVWPEIVAADDVFQSVPWQRVVHDSVGAWLQYLVAEDKDGSRAGLALALALEGNSWPMGRPDVVLAAAVESGYPNTVDLSQSLSVDGASPAQALLPSVAGGGRHLGQTRFVGTPTPALVDALLDRAELHARCLGARSVSLPFLPDDAVVVDALRARGYTSFMSGEYAVLDLPEGGLEGHLRRLSKSRRDACRRERRKCAAAGVEVVRMAVGDAPIDQLAHLESTLLLKHGTEWPVANARGWLARIAAIAPDESSVLVAFADGAPRGFVLVYEQAGHWALRQAGFDYEWQAASGAPVYFETIFYRAIEEAALAGVRRLHYGLGSTQTKASRGCEIVLQRCWFKEFDKEGRA